MKKISSTFVKMAVVLVAVCSVIIAANAGYVSDPLNSQNIIQRQPAQMDSYANISFTIFEGDGCGCTPRLGVPINATGRDTEHSASGLTDEDGKCVLQLEYGKTYRVSIEEVDHESVLFDFDVMDNQMFQFHVKFIDTSTASHFSFIQMILQKLLALKH
jgi:hypothetical protein